MSRRTALAIIGAILAGAALLALLTRRDREPASTTPPPSAPTTEARAERTAVLYFPGEGDRLAAEERDVPPGVEGVALARYLLGELLAGPVTEGLRPPLPEGTAIDFVEPARDGTLYVSLAPPAGQSPPRYGARAEILAAYSLVNSLCANVPEVDRVSFLWNGVEPTTFAGHLDTRRPLAPEPRWIGSPG